MNVPASSAPQPLSVNFISSLREIPSPNSCFQNSVMKTMNRPMIPPE